jgi:hypothetical protein
MKKKELLEMIRQLEKRVDELERKNTNTQFIPPMPQVFIPSVWEIDPCVHEYPNPWMATIPPSCKKCGKQAPTWTVTCSTSNNLEDLADQEVIEKIDERF